MAPPKPGDIVRLLRGTNTLARLAAELPPERAVEVNKYAALALIVLRLVRQKIPARDAPPTPAAPATPPAASQ